MVMNPRKKIFSNILFFVLLGAVFSLYTLDFSLAQAPAGRPEGLTISPPIEELTLNPGETSDQKIQVTNPTNELLEFYPSVMNFGAGGESGEPNFYPDSSQEKPFSMASWITVDQSKIAILPNQVSNLNYKIAVPQNAEPGGHYGVVFLGTEPPAASGEVSQVAIASKVGSLVLVRVPGDIQEEGNLEEFSTPWFYFQPPIAFTTFIRNKGNIHFKPEGEITIRNWRGKVSERIAINQLNGNVLPESRRKFEVKWDAPAKPFWKIPIGRFSADLRAVYGQSEQTFGSKIYFWIIPWWIIILAAVLVLILIIFIIRRKKRKNRKPPTTPGSPASYQKTINLRQSYPPRKIL
jgi:hypothetical protein